MRSSRSAGVALALAALSLLPATASAQTRTQGTPLSIPATGTWGCETRWLPGYTYPYEYQPQQIGGTCTMFMPGTNTDNTHLVPGNGTVTKVRVRSGSNPAPLKVTVMKQLFQKNPDPPHQITDTTCCTGVRESQTFQPTPNATTEVTVNLPVTISDSVNGASGHHDIVALSAVGDGTMPLGETGPHTAAAGQEASTPTVQARYPRVNPGDSNQNRWDYPNWVLLMNYTWVGCPRASSVRASQACGDPKAKAAVSSKRLRLKKGKVKVAVRCTAPASERCKGKLRLRTRAKKPKLLASKRLNIAGGKKATVTLRLSKKARKRLKKKTTKVQVKIDLGSAGTTAKNLKLKR